MFKVALAGSSILFVEADVVPSHHLAFRVGDAVFDAVVGRLRADGIAFGNEPEHARTLRYPTPLGGAGRVYFSSADQHLFEVTVG